MPDVSINIDVYCGKCGAGLCQQTGVSYYRGNQSFNVDPCQNCLDEAKEEGYQDGLVDTETEGNK